MRRSPRSESAPIRGSDANRKSRVIRAVPGEKKSGSPSAVLSINKLPHCKMPHLYLEGTVAHGT
jgi:hypothetical protein